MGRSWENLFFALKNWILATLPELAKFTLKSMDSGHVWADPGKICFLDPKTGFWPTTQNQTAPAYVLARWRISRRLSGYIYIYIHTYIRMQEHRDIDDNSVVGPWQTAQ